MKIKKRIILGISLLLIGSFTLLITKDLINKDKTFIVKSNNIKKNKNTMAVYVIEDNGEYKQVDHIPQSGYQLNKSKSTCSNGAIPGWDTKTSRFYADNLTKNGTSCYLYFDKYVPTASEIILSNLGENIKTNTPDFSRVATSDEGVFATADGMYGGKTYYWRGAATNNHVIFANKCWRIVRINGDNTLRLIYNGAIQSGNTCKGNGANADAVIFPNDDNTDSSINLNIYATPNGKIDNNSYVGWTYVLGKQRPELTDIAVDSNAKAQTEWWHSNNIGNNEEWNNKVVSGKFCNDRSTKNSEPWHTNSETSQYYSGYDRLYNNYQPTLECNLGDIYTLKAGAIIADEIEMAGGNTETNSSYYLYTGHAYWTMSPCGWVNTRALVFYMYSDGVLGSAYFNNAGLRPVINLKSDVTFSSGNGEQSTPYIVS